MYMGVILERYRLYLSQEGAPHVYGGDPADKR